MSQKVTIWLKDVGPGLREVQNFSQVIDLRVVEGVYFVQVEDGSTASFPIHNVLASSAEDEA